jgi:integrase
MSLYRHKRSRFWQFDFQISGQRFSGSTEVTDKREATIFEKERKAEARRLVESITRTNSTPLCIDRAAARWWDEHGRNLNDPDLKARLDWLVVAIGPRTPLHAITNDTVSKLVQARKSDVRRAGRDEHGKQLYRQITARTVNKTTVSLLRRVVRRAKENWNVVLPIEPVWKKHLLKETRRAVRELTPTEDLRLDAIECAEFANLRRFAEITGLRRRNLLLSWSQVDFDAAVIRIISKGDVPRTLPLSRDAYSILWAQRGHHSDWVFTFIAQRTRKCPKTGQRFFKGTRYPITYYGIGSNHRKWVKAGVDARIHDLRHTTGMRTLRATGNLRIVQKILGHTDIAITAKFYTDATIEDMRSAMEATASSAPKPRDAESDASNG